MQFLKAGIIKLLYVRLASKPIKMIEFKIFVRFDENIVTLGFI